MYKTNAFRQDLQDHPDISFFQLHQEAEKKSCKSCQKKNTEIQQKKIIPP